MICLLVYLFNNTFLTMTDLKNILTVEKNGVLYLTINR
ncbi:MAG: hypothetical protein ACI8YP_003620, partial [Algoriphagus sp.]